MGPKKKSEARTRFETLTAALFSVPKDKVAKAKPQRPKTRRKG
jgi:hypothetical protein